MSIHRLFVTKKQPFDIEAKSILNDLRTSLNLQNLTNLKLFNRYDVQDLSDQDFKSCIHTVFAEPTVDEVCTELSLSSDEHAIAIKYLPGQYDQRADSAEQCIQAVVQSIARVETARVYLLTGKINDDEINKVKKYLINPVDSMEASMDKPVALDNIKDEIEDVKIIEGFCGYERDELLELHREYGLAMSIEDLLHTQNYYLNEKRDPTETEIRVLDTYWSDHCRHTTFLTKLMNITFDNGKTAAMVKDAFSLYLNEREKVYKGRERALSLMDIAVMGMKVLKKKGLLNDLDESDEINACSINIKVDVDGVEQDWLLMFKNETHNHPTEIEPFGGAATCLGGAIRDPLSGRSYVYQAMRITGSGDPRTRYEDTLPGKLPQRKITTEAAHGYSSYGNQIGLATGLVTEIYHEGYVAKRLEIGAVIGAAKKEHVVRETPEPGDAVILIGGRTGRDGCGGATGSSKKHTEESILTCGAEVQKGNPPTERKLQRLFRNPDVCKLIKRCNDFGAGGVSVAIGELADSLEINLDAVPKKYNGLNGTETAISESQERMAVVVAAKNVRAFVELAADENLEAAEVAVVTDSGRLVMKFNGNTVVDISREFLNTNGAEQQTDVHVVNYNYKMNEQNKDDLLSCLSSLSSCGQKGLSENFGSTIGSGTVLMPFGGVNQLTPPQAMVAKIPVIEGNTTTCSLMSYGFDPVLSEKSPYHGAYLAVLDSVAKIVATGGEYRKVRLSFQEYFESLGKDPNKWGKPFASLLGAFKAQIDLGIPSIGGKDSMSGTFGNLTVPPTLVSFAVCVESINNIVSTEFKNTNSNIIKLSAGYDENGLPKIDECISNFIKVHELITNGKVLAACALGSEGAAVNIAKMCIGNNIGAEFNGESLYDQAYGSFIIETKMNVDEIESCLKGFDYTVIGKTTNDGHITINGKRYRVADAANAWLEPLENIFPTKCVVPDMDIFVPLYDKPYMISSGKKKSAPAILMPVFPGTNCEYDMAKVFAEAGGIIKCHVIKNRSIDELNESISELARLINQSQIIAFSGGFSAGDEPEGSGKFIAAIFRNPALQNAVMNLLNKRDGLMIGICNGFQALVKLGLLPYGEIRDIEANFPTLTYNAIGRHISCLAQTRIVSNHSPWLMDYKAGEVLTVPVTHCEGRFICGHDEMDKLIKNHQIATQYIDFNGNPSMDSWYNPNGSDYAIEGITSPDGRIIGKMGHSERTGFGLYKNVVYNPGANRLDSLFKSGVKYFM